MPEGYAWSENQRWAAGFAWHAASTGLGQESSWIDYRGGGGVITRAEWRDLYKAAWSSVGWRESIAAVPMDWEIPLSMFGKALYNYSEQYNVRHLVRWFDPSVDDWREQNIQVMSESLLTKRDWRTAVEEWLEDYGRRGEYLENLGYEILEYEAMEVR